MPRPTKWPYTEQTENGSWRASVMIAGKRVKGKQQKTAKAAHEDAMHLLGSRVGSLSMTIEQAQTSILTDLGRRGRREGTVEAMKSHLAPAIEFFGEDRRLSTITVDDVQRFIDERRKTCKGLTVKHNVAMLARALAVAEVNPNPATSPKLILPKIEKRSLSLRMSWPELLTVMRKLRDLGLQTELAVVAFVAGTGVRRAEFARMQKTDLDLLGERIVIPVGKTDPRELPLPRGSGDVASAWTCAELMLGFNDGKKAGPFLLPGKDERQRVEWLRQVIDRARAQTGQEKLQLHELRRCFASRVAEKFPVPVVSALLGHALPGVTGLYVHADQKVLRAAMEDVWSDFDAE